MKSTVVILLLAVSGTVLFSGCKTCYPCLAQGESFNLPYSPSHTIIFVNDSQVEKIFSVALFGGWPSTDYCGRVGSGSYGACGASLTALLSNSQDSINIIAECTTGYNDNVEQYVIRQVGIGWHLGPAGWLMTIKKGVCSPSVANATVKNVNSVTIDGIQYSNVYEYQNISAGINECANFVYSVDYGVLKFTIRHENSDENWFLVKTR